jgi:hypothetical protein
MGIPRFDYYGLSKFIAIIFFISSILFDTRKYSQDELVSYCI